MMSDIVMCPICHKPIAWHGGIGDFFGMLRLSELYKQSRGWRGKKFIFSCGEHQFPMCDMAFSTDGFSLYSTKT